MVGPAGGRSSFVFLGCGQGSTDIPAAELDGVHQQRRQLMKR